jgi:hypothetical protein
MRKARGVTLMTVLMFVGLTVGMYCIVAFGQAYWEKFQIGGILRQAANECYRQSSDAAVRQFIVRQLHITFDEVREDVSGRREARLPFMFDDGDMQIQRTEVPKYVHIWFTYRRRVRLPLLDQERVLTFTEHAEQDLSPVKW